MKYVTPMSRETSAHSEQPNADEQLRRQLQAYFVRNCQSTSGAIRKAIEGGDRLLASRLAHSLKSGAGQLGQHRLQNAAANADRLLQKGNLPEEDLSLLEAELNAVLRELAPLISETGVPTKTLDPVKVRELLEKLETMLNNRNPECLNLLDDISAMPGAEELGRQVEDLDFKLALATLSELRKQWL